MIMLEGIAVESGEVQRVWIKLPLSKEERLTGTIDGTNTVFLSGDKYLAGSCEVYLNGLKIIAGEHFAETGEKQITLADAPQLGDDLIIKYLRGI